MSRLALFPQVTGPGVGKSLSPPHVVAHDGRVHHDERANRHWDTVSRLTQLNYAARRRRARLQRRTGDAVVAGSVVATTFTRGPGPDAGRRPSTAP
jgi:hypothetical protein